MAKRSSDKPPVPSEDAREWLKKRIEDTREGSVAAMSKRMFGHKDILARVLAGTRNLKTDEMIEFADAIKVPIPLLLRTLGYDITGGVCKVVATVDLKARLVDRRADVNPYVLCPEETVSFDQFAAACVHSPQRNSPLSIFHGSYLFFERELRGIHSDTLRGHLSIFRFKESPVPVVGILESSSASKTRIGLFGSEDKIETTGVQTATPVRWIKVG